MNRTLLKLSLLTLGFLPVSMYGQEQAQTNLRFVDSIGVNTHLNYTDTQYANASFVANEVNKLGIKHIRDGTSLIANSNSYPAAYNAFLQMGAAGVRYVAGYGTIPQGQYIQQFSTATFQSGIATMTVNGTSYIEALEGQNEVDGSYLADANWETDWATMQNNLITADTMKMPVVSTSLAYSGDFLDIPSAPQAQVPGITIYGNLHAYAQNHMPGRIWTDGQFANIRHEFPSPFVIIQTETGYQDAMSSGPSGQYPVDDTAQVKYIPRSLLESFRAGVYRTFLYQFLDTVSTPNDNNLVDSPPGTCAECHYGLIDLNGNEKPQYTALQNLISTLNSGATADAPGSLVYSLTGNTANVHHVLLQKSPGVFDLVLWQEVSSFNETTLTDITNPTVAVNLVVNASSVSTYNPSASTTSTPLTLSGQSVNLAVPDQPLIVEIVTGPRHPNYGGNFRKN